MMNVSTNDIHSVEKHRAYFIVNFYLNCGSDILVCRVLLLRDRRYTSLELGLNETFKYKADYNDNPTID